MAEGVLLPFTSAALAYREKIFTTSWTPGANVIDLSPPSGGIKSYGYMRALRLLVTTSSAGTGGNLGADNLYGLFSQMAVTQPNGEEYYGGPTFSGFHGGMAAVHDAWRHANDPTTLPSYTNSATSPQISLPIVFEINNQQGIGSIPNQDASAPWKLQLTGATSAAVYQTAPTTAPTLQLDVFLDAWTVPAPVNPLNPNVRQAVAPELLGTLNKWTMQQYALVAGGSNNVLLSRKGNSIRNLVFILLNSANARIAATNYPNPFTFRWDGTNVRANDSMVLVLDDEYMTRGGNAGSTPVTSYTGVRALQMADVSGLDAQGVASPAPGLYGMGKQWGTVQSSTIELDGTFGATAATLQVLTNDVQFVNLAGNPYALNYPGGVYLQAPAQTSARP